VIDDKEKEIIELYKNKVSIKNIGLKMGCSSYPIRRILGNHNLIRKVQRKHKQVNKNIIQQIISMHENDIACGDIAIELNLDIWTVNYHLRKNNIKPKNLVSNEKTSVSNEFSFKEMTKEKAFALGVIFGDGHVGEKITIYGSKKDIDILNKINSTVGGKCKIILDKRTENSLYIHLNKTKLAKELQNDFQLKSNKSDNIIFPKLNEEFVPAFISGFLAADGSIFIADKKRGYLRITFSSCSLVFLESIQNLLCNGIGIKKNNITKTKPKNQYAKKMFYCLIFNGQNAVKVCQYLYDNTTPETRSDRKFQVYLDHIARKN